MAWPVTFNGPSTRLIACPIIDASSSHLRSLRQRTAQRALGQLDFEVVVALSDGVLHGSFGSSPDGGHRCGTACQNYLRGDRTPGLVRHAAEPDPGCCVRPP